MTDNTKHNDVLKMTANVSDLSNSSENANHNDALRGPIAGDDSPEIVNPEHIESPSRPPVTAPSHAGFARNASIVAIAFVVSRLLGFAREVLIAARFGTDGEATAYIAAFRVPDLIFLVVMTAAFGSAFIPVFAGFLGQHEEAKAQQLANAVLTWTMLIAIGTGIIMFTLAGPIIRYIVAPGLSAEYVDLAANLMRLLLFSPILLGLGIAAKGILEAHEQFLLPAIAPIIYNLGIVFGAIALTPAFGVQGLVFGVIIGAAGHFAVQAPGLIRSGLRFRPTFDRKVEGLDTVWRLLLPRIAGQFAFQANFIIITAFASQVGDSGPAAVNYAWQLLMLPHGILALSISTVIFPAMSKQFQTGDFAGLRSTFGRALRPLVFLSVPAAIGLFAFREPIVRVIFEVGAFDEESTAQVVAPLGFLALGLVGYGLVEVLTRAFYAMQDARTPVIAATSIVAINLLICWLTVDRLGLAGLALGLTVSTAIEAIILAVVLVRRLEQRGLTMGTDWIFWLYRVGLAALVLTAISFVLAVPLERLVSEPDVPRFVDFVFVAFAIAIAAVAYGLVALLGDMREATSLVSAVASRSMLVVNRLPYPTHTRVNPEPDTSPDVSNKHPAQEHQRELREFNRSQAEAEQTLTIRTKAPGDARQEPGRRPAGKSNEHVSTSSARPWLDTNPWDPTRGRVTSQRLSADNRAVDMARANPSGGPPAGSSRRQSAGSPIETGHRSGNGRPLDYTEQNARRSSRHPSDEK